MVGEGQRCAVGKRSAVVHRVHFAGTQLKPEGAACAPNADVVAHEIERVAIAIDGAETGACNTGDDLGDGAATTRAG